MKRFEPLPLVFLKPTPDGRGGWRVRTDLGRASRCQEICDSVAGLD